MDSFLDDLRRARSEKQMTLQQVSDLTLINIDFLEAIDRGDLSFLPQAYIRAFIREYALVVGLDSRDVIKQYEEESRLAQTPPKEEQPATTAQREQPRRAFPQKEQEDRSAFPAKPAWLVTAAIGLFTIVVLILALRDTPSDAPVEEIPFQSVVKQNEQRIAGNLPDPRQVDPAPPSAPADSMTLSAVISDSVWIQVIIDTQDPREYIFPPNRRMSWKAADKFVVTLGNAGAVEFRLNQKSLGVLGSPGAVLRNVEFNRSMLSTN